MECLFGSWVCLVGLFPSLAVRVGFLCWGSGRLETSLRML